jgi:hypothetical protein
VPHLDFNSLDSAIPLKVLSLKIFFLHSICCFHFLGGILHLLQVSLSLFVCFYAPLSPWGFWSSLLYRVLFSTLASWLSFPITASLVTVTYYIG